MNKILKSIITLSCAALLLGSMTACSNTVINAYDIAVKNGYQGTEAEWLKTLQGKDGADGQDLTAKDLYETAQENGYTGTYLEFCRDVLQVQIASNNDVDAIANNVTSVVSIHCGFTKTTYYGGYLGMPKTTPYYSSGSGVILDLDKEEGDALIVTNYHVIYDSGSDIETGISDGIYLYPYGSSDLGFAYQNGDFLDVNGYGIEATFVGGAMNYDIAILRVEDSEQLKKSVVTQAKVGDSDKVQLGEKVYAIGNPEGEGISVTAGIVSVESEYIEMTSTDGKNVVDYRVIRTDAAINSGNSGGALFNADGELIGIVNAKSVDSTVDNIGYALPSTHVKNLFENILYNEKTYGDGSVRVATLGVLVSTTGSEAYFDDDGALRIKEEITVSKVVSTSSAAYDILKAGDVLKAIKVGDGEWFTLTRQYQLLDRLLLVKEGDVVQIKRVDTHGDEGTVEITFNSNYFTIYN